MNAAQLYTASTLGQGQPHATPVARSGELGASAATQDSVAGALSPPPLKRRRSESQASDCSMTSPRLMPRSPPLRALSPHGTLAPSGRSTGSPLAMRRSPMGQGRRRSMSGGEDMPSLTLPPPPVARRARSASFADARGLENGSPNQGGDLLTAPNHVWRAMQKVQHACLEWLRGLCAAGDADDAGQGDSSSSSSSSGSSSSRARDRKRQRRDGVTSGDVLRFARCCVFHFNNKQDYFREMPPAWRAPG